MRKPPNRPEALARKMFRGSLAIRRGWLTKADLRSSAWRPLFRDVYIDRTLTVTHGRRCLAASHLLLPQGAAIAGRSAAHLYGASLLNDDDQVEVLSSRPFGPVKGLLIHRGPLDEAEVVKRNGVMVTVPLRTCWDVARWLDPVESVMFLDALAAKRIVAATELIQYAADRSGERGWRRVLRVARWMDPSAESPQESRLRVKVLLAGLPRPVVQHVVTRNGAFLARVDMAWPELKIALEYDGRWHAEAAQLERDRRRLNDLLGADWLVFHVTAWEMRHGLDEVIRQIRAAIRGRSRLTRVR